MYITKFPLNLTTISVIIFFFFFLFIEKWNKSKQARPVKLPPGPKRLPIIGNLHHITSVPFRSFRDLSKKYGPIMHLTLGQVPTIVVSSPEIVKEMLKDNDSNYANRPENIAFEIMWYNYADLAFSPYGGYWRQMRKICILELLSPKNVRSFGSIRNDEVSQMVESIRLTSSGKPVNFTKTVFSMTNSIMCRAVCGRKVVCAHGDGDLLIKLILDGLEMAGGFEVSDLFPSSKFLSALSYPVKMRLVRMRRKIDAILDAIIDEHKARNGELGNEDLIDVFLRIKESGEIEFPIGNDNIKAIILDMFAAGTHTSSSTIDWAMVELIRNPRVMEKAQAELRQAFKGDDKLIIEEHELQKLKYLKLVIKESLRLHPPTPILPRASIDECVIDGYTIPAKTRVLVNNWAIHRDPKYWNNPEDFEPDRFESHGGGGEFQYLPFGAGKRSCPGMNFGLANVELPLAQLLYSFDWKLPKNVKAESLDMMETRGVSATRKERLFVVATPYQSFARA